MSRFWLEKLDAGKLVEALEELKRVPMIGSMQQRNHCPAHSYVLHGDDQLGGCESGGFVGLTVSVPMFSVGAQDLPITKPFAPSRESTICHCSRDSVPIGIACCRY